MDCKYCYTNNKLKSNTCSLTVLVKKKGECKHYLQLQSFRMRQSLLMCTLANTNDCQLLKTCSFVILPYGFNGWMEKLSKELHKFYTMWAELLWSFLDKSGKRKANSSLDLILKDQSDSAWRLQVLIPNIFFTKTICYTNRALSFSFILQVTN